MGQPQSRSSLDPHGYQPVLVDEAVLSDEERHEVFLDSIRLVPGQPPDNSWFKHLTPEERRRYRAAAQCAYQQPAVKDNFILDGRPVSADDVVSHLSHVGMLRAYARRKYSGGRPIWYGDGVPFQQPGG
jgi:hypothetical protein